MSVLAGSPDRYVAGEYTSDDQTPSSSMDGLPTDAYGNALRNTGYSPGAGGARYGHGVRYADGFAGQSTDGYTSHSGTTAHTGRMMAQIEGMSDLNTSAEHYGATRSDLSDSGLTDGVASGGVLRGCMRTVAASESDHASGRHLTPDASGLSTDSEASSNVSDSDGDGSIDVPATPPSAARPPIRHAVRV